MSECAHIKIGGAPTGFDALFIAREFSKHTESMIFVARDALRMQAMQTALALVAPDILLDSFLPWDCTPYDRMSPRKDIIAARATMLLDLTKRKNHTKRIVLTTLNAASQRVLPREMIANNVLDLAKGMRLDQESLCSFLDKAGYVATSSVLEQGDFAIRGGLIDIFSPGRNLPLRLDFFGDSLDQIRLFEPTTQRTEKTIDKTQILPVSDVFLDEKSIAHFRKSYRMAFGPPNPGDSLYEAISAGQRLSGMEHWFGHFYPKTETLFDYLQGAHVVLDDQFDNALEARSAQISDLYAARKVMQDSPGMGQGSAPPSLPEMLYLTPQNLSDILKKHRVLRLNAMPQPPGPNIIDAGGRHGRNFSAERKQEGINLFQTLSEHIRTIRKSRAAVIASFSEGARERLSHLIADEGITDAIPVSDFSIPLTGKTGVYLIVWPLETGFSAEKLTVISEQDILGDRLINPPRKRKRAENFLKEADSLGVGDLVVHLDHGVGRYLGIETITADGAPHDCLALEYAEGNRLYLPIENIELLSPFGQEDAPLDRLGGGNWSSRKAQVKARLHEIAEKLMRIAGARVLRRAPVISVCDDMFESFSLRFAHQETDDQLAAISDIMVDLESGKPMDRLICGDVGFGKTEVAMRAAFAAVMAGWQVVVIAPTTLLARQHYNSFKERFQGFPIKICQLSRLVPAREASQTRADSAAGIADIIIGTHAILSKSLTFKKLGLLVVDEEQKFGVVHKERLKELRENIHILTLTATPIPRTLQLSLSGIRDLSIIATPPVDRLSVRSFIGEFDPVVLREALLREHYRGGQSFFVVPRVSDLTDIEAFLNENVPEVKFITAHGQMAAGDLDKRMNAFYDGKYGILLATTIIESGIDIPNANTIIIHRADMFGLAQLYQLRGRVGRSKLRAFAYLTTKPRKPLSPVAEKRLRILGSFDSLGAGFTLASQDLDLRGAGSLVGDDQSGHTRDVGYALYQSMLEDAIAKIKAGEEPYLTEIEDRWAPQINLGVPVLIPADYVTDLDTRLGLYRRLSSLSKKVELEGFAAELIDRFGPLPKEINMLIVIIRIKAMCKRAGIARFDGGPKGATIRFHNDKFVSPLGLVNFLDAQKGMAKFRDSKIIIRRDWKQNNDRLKGAYSIARDLAEIVIKAEKKSKSKS